ncbi:MAG: hypothetical protein H6959_00060 [Chromatiaceae bacterium]|nr:hypothetical protein [Chromatiaceae bacterium]MCP5421286.1 hypothetical protein [Chromatiaceae bacterium]
MQYSPALSIEHGDYRPLSTTSKYIIIAALAALAGYGLGSHHVLLVAFGALAVIAVQRRVGAIDASADVDHAHTVVDGGIFPGRDRPAADANMIKPAVVDGGISKAHRNGGRFSTLG